MVWYSHLLKNFPQIIVIYTVKGFGIVNKVEIDVFLELTCFCESLQMVTAAMKLRHFFLGRKAMTNLDSLLKGRDITFPTKARLVKAMVFPLVMYGCESWTIKKAEHRRTEAFELWCWKKILEIPLDCKEIQPVHPKGNQSWVFIGRTDFEAESPILWPPHEKN